MLEEFSRHFIVLIVRRIGFDRERTVPKLFSEFRSSLPRSFRILSIRMLNSPIQETANSESKECPKTVKS